MFRIRDLSFFRIFSFWFFSLFLSYILLSCFYFFYFSLFYLVFSDHSFTWSRLTFLSRILGYFHSWFSAFLFLSRCLLCYPCSSSISRLPSFSPSISRNSPFDTRTVLTPWDFHGRHPWKATVIARKGGERGSDTRNNFPSSFSCSTWI